MTLISCLMITRGALHPARHAIACFQAQTHPDLELVIVCDAARAPLRTHVEALADPRIRWIVAAPSPLGTLRQISVDAARGVLICQWDDDDLHRADRAAVQAAALERAEADACFLARWTMWWPARRLLAVSAPRIWEGSMLARRGVLSPYPAVPTGEDTAVAKLIPRQRRTLIDAPQVYCYVIHGGNAFPPAHYARLFAVATPIADYDAALTGLARTQPVDAYRADLSASGSR